MTTIQKVAVFGASGNFGAPVTAALVKAGFKLTIISRAESAATFPSGIPVIKVAYTPENLVKALFEQDAAVCVVGPAGVHHQMAMIDAAEAAGVKRFIVDDFGWGPNVRGLPEFHDVHTKRKAQWDHAMARANTNPNFTWTGISTGNPVDWAIKKFSLMGFNINDHSAIIYDNGEEEFTGTTLDGIAQSVVGVLTHPEETTNRFVKVLSTKTCQNKLLQAFQRVTGEPWTVRKSTTRELMATGRSKLANGSGGWVLDLVVAQLYDEGEARCVVANRRSESDSDLLGLAAETEDQIASKALGLV
ncbi:NmrA-like family protein [Diaporthe sp. PMI_573]|nr:NmrA-like family protein [Diaporthaceae sp. PMI_573]